MKKWINVIVFVILIFSNFIQIYIPRASITDELIALLGVTSWFVVTVKNGFKIKKSILQIVLGLVVLYLIGIISSLIFAYSTDLTSIFKDMFQLSKFFFAFVGLKYIVRTEQSDMKVISMLSRLIIAIMFVFGIVNIFADIGMGSSYRYGIRAYSFVYTHYTYLTFNTVILLVFASLEDHKFNKYDVMGLLVLAMTLRTKAFMILALYLIAKLYVFGISGQPRKLNKYRISLLIVPTMLVSFPTIQSYLSWGDTYNLRNGLYTSGLTIMKDHFPFGSGFASFASMLSFDAGSTIYSKYDLYRLQYFNTGYFSPVSDVYWPYIYGQLGFFGFVLYVTILLICIKESLASVAKNEYFNFAVIIIWVYVLISSIAESTFTNETGVFVAYFITLFTNYISKKKHA